MDDYPGALGWLYSLMPAHFDLKLERVRAALEAWGHPERAFPSVIVAGTNGKGSTAHFLSEGMAAFGWRVGTFTSPHLHRFGERIRVGGEPLSEAATVAFAQKLRREMETGHLPALSFFEATTLMALETFRRAQVDWAVLEVGLGGRLDATNAVDAELAILTEVGLDHQAYLGPTLRHIAKEKAAVCRPGKPFLVGASAQRVQTVAQAFAQRIGAHCALIGRDFHVQREGSELTLRVAASWVRDQEALGSRAPRGHLSAQVREATEASPLDLSRALAWRALLHLGAGESPERLKRATQAVARATWAGRFEWHHAGHHAVLLDGAHNPQGASALRAYLETHPNFRAAPQRTLIFGAMRDKDPGSLLAIVGSLFDRIVLLPLPLSRSASASDLLEAAAETCKEACVSVASEPEEALAEVLGPARAGDSSRVTSSVSGALQSQGTEDSNHLVVAAGSLFVMAAVRACLLKLTSDPPVAS